MLFVVMFLPIMVLFVVALFIMMMVMTMTRKSITGVIRRNRYSHKTAIAYIR